MSMNNVEFALFANKTKIYKCFSRFKILCNFIVTFPATHLHVNKTE